jgi:hypothetical protein
MGTNVSFFKTSCEVQGKFFIFALGFALQNAVFAQPTKTLPIFDAHMHYNVEAFDYMPPEKVFALFQKENVTSVLANSRPNAGSWALMKFQRENPKTNSVRIVPFVRVYRDRDDYGTWFQKPEVYAHIVEQLNGEPRARGIGEFHLNGEQAAHAGVTKIMTLAKERNLWLHAHVDFPGLKIMLAQQRDAKIIWAHTGFNTPHGDVAQIMRDHPNVIGELSYRGDVSNGQSLSAEWKQLFTQYPDRFLVGSDTWVNQRWEMYAETMAHYRNWLAQLPMDVAKKIAHENGERLFGLK